MHITRTIYQTHFFRYIFQYSDDEFIDQEEFHRAPDRHNRKDSQCCEMQKVRQEQRGRRALSAERYPVSANICTRIKNHPENSNSNFRISR